MSVVELFIKSGSILNPKTKEGWTPLMGSAYQGWFQKLNQSNRSNTYVWLKFLGYANIASFLIKSGANINERDNDGFTPLHFAVMRSIFVRLDINLIIWKSAIMPVILLFLDL